MNRIGTTTTTRRQRKQPHIGSENAGNCAGGAQCGYDRSRVEHDMRSRSREATREIECQIAEMTQTILNRRTEQPQRPHVQDGMEPSAVRNIMVKKGTKSTAARSLSADARASGCARESARIDVGTAQAPRGSGCPGTETPGNWWRSE